MAAAVATGLWCCSICAGQQEPADPVQVPAAPGQQHFSAKVIFQYVRINDDVKTGETARQIIDEVDRVDRGGADLLVLELGCNEIRDDLAALIARRIDSVSVPIVAVLRDSHDKQFGVNALLLSLCADYAWIDENAMLRDDLSVHHRELAPKELDPESLSAQMMNIAWTRLEKRGADPAVAQRICVPAGTYSLVRAPDGSLVGQDEQLSESATAQMMTTRHEQVVQHSSSQSASADDYLVTLSSAQVVALHFARYVPRSDYLLEREILDAFGAYDSDDPSVMPSYHNRYTTIIKEHFDEMNREARKVLDFAGMMARNAKSDINHARSRRGDAVRLSSGIIEKTKKSVEFQITSAEETMNGLEQGLLVWPEIVRTPAPGHALGEHATMAQRETAWRKAVSDIRKDIEKAREELAELVRERR